MQPTSKYLDIDVYNERNYFVPGYKANSDDNLVNAKIVGVGDNVPLIAIEDTSFRGRAGEAEEAFRFRYIKSTCKRINRNKFTWRQ